MNEPRSQSHWLPIEDAKLRDYCRRGISSLVIGALIGRSESSVVTRRSNLQIPPARGFRRAYPQVMERLLRTGMTPAEVAAKMGCAIESVEHFAKHRRYKVDGLKVGVGDSPLSIVQAMPVPDMHAADVAVMRDARLASAQLRQAVLALGGHKDVARAGPMTFEQKLAAVSAGRARVSEAA